MNKKISEKAFEKIKENDIKPRPKWEFLLKDYTVWSLFGISLIVGGLAVSVLIYMLVNNDWDLYGYVSGSFLAFFFATLPYFWIVVLIIFVVLAYYNLKHTKKGYLLSLGKVLTVSLVVSFLMGGSLYAAGLSDSINRVFSGEVPYYDKMTRHRMVIWDRPEKGLLAGKVTEVEGGSKFHILDLNGKEWCVECLDILKCPNKNWKDRGVKVIGKKGDDCFKAKIIRESGPMRHMHMQMRNKGCPNGAGHMNHINCPIR